MPRSSNITLMEILGNTIEELCKGVKRLQCNSDFMLRLKDDLMLSIPPSHIVNKLVKYLLGFSLRQQILEVIMNSSPLM